MDDLVKTALLGTAKQTADVVDFSCPTDAMLDDLSEVSPEHRVLLAAGLRAVYRQAGRSADRLSDDAIPDPAPLEADRQQCSPKLISMLEEIFQKKDHPLALEVLYQMDAAGLRFPPPLLPLALSQTKAQVRQRMLPILGDRGRWLAQFDPSWSWARHGEVKTVAEKPTEEELSRFRDQWEMGTIGERCDILRRLRTVDPETARDWLTETLPSEKADHRQRLIQPLGERLSIDDEPMLEELLSDRSEKVRRHASRFLASLPDSQLSERMRQRADEILTGEQVDGKLQLTSHPPAELDKEWIRDGIPKKAPRGRGARSYWLEIVVELVPPSYWSTRFKASPDELIEAIVEDDYAITLLTAWTTAAVRFAPSDSASAEWLAPLWNDWCKVCDSRKKGASNEDAERLGGILEAMPADVANRLLLQRIEATYRLDDPTWILLASRLPTPWTAEFSTTYIEIIRKIVSKTKSNYAYQVVDMLHVAAGAIPVDLIEPTLNMWEEMLSTGAMKNDGWLGRQIAAVTATLNMRQLLYKEVGSG